MLIAGSLFSGSSYRVMGFEPKSVNWKKQLKNRPTKS